MRNYLIYSLLYFPFFLFAQGKTIEAVIIDAKDLQPIPYASIFYVDQNKGTVSNEEGFFRLERLPDPATIEISFIGYQTERYSVEAVPDTIFLKVRNEVLHEVELLADNSFLYYLLSRSKKTSSYQTRKAKSYFSLETHIDTTQVELVESYYNGTYQTYDLNKLDLKTGRLGLKNYKEEMFVSVETSRALHMHRLFDKNDYFPTSPFELKKNKLKKKYDLLLHSKYKDSDQRTIYVVDYTPKKNKENYFEGRVWIDSLSAQIKKLSLNIENAAIYPFVPISREDSLLSVSMQITKSFIEIDGSPYVNAIDFNYNLKYKARKDYDQIIAALRSSEIKNVSSKAVLYAYNYDEEFLLPFFNIFEGNMSDYRLLNAIPYNRDFWSHMDEFRFNDQVHQNQKFISEQADLDSENIFQPNDYFDKGFWEHAYLQWNKKRIYFRGQTDREEDYNQYQHLIPSDRYHLEAQLFLDVNQFGDSLYVNTCAIMDPYQTFYHFPQTAQSNAFINMYFDLIEIHRRNLEEEIHLSAKNPEDVSRIYARKQIQLEKICENFFKEVVRGSNQIGMEKWNRYIFDALEIDNLNLFAVSYDE